MRNLEDCRKEIDEIDAEIVKLFERRMNVSHDIALYKQAHYMDILNPAREDAVLRSRAHQAASPELAQSVMSLFGEIMRLSRQLRGCVQSYGGSKLPGKLRDRLQVFFYRLLIPLGIWRFRVIDHIIIHDNSCSIRHRPSGQTVLQT